MDKKRGLTPVLSKIGVFVQTSQTRIFEISWKLSDFVVTLSSKTRTGCTSAITSELDCIRFALSLHHQKIHTIS